MNKESNKSEIITTPAIGWRAQWAVLMRRRATRWSVRMLFFLLFIGIFADFLANEKPLYCQIDGVTYFPVCKEYAVWMGWGSWDSKFIRKDWQDHNYEKKIMPPIPYSPTTMDRNNTRFKSPFDEQNVPALRYRHWMGTDKLGRDVTSGMIYGTRVAMMVGILSMLLAGMIGILLGGLAGYFGNDNFKASVIGILTGGVGFLLGIFYGFTARRYSISEGSFFWEAGKGLLILFVVWILFILLGKLLQTFPFLGKKIILPLDNLLMRLIEVINSIPGLLVLLSVLSVLQSKSIYNIILLIGLLGWTTIARYTRGEMLRVRQLPYIQAARSLGYSSWRVVWRHALPNALTPVLITLSFGVAGAILSEATISFLGIGVPFNSFTWGKMLSIARSNFSAWWLVVFPGIGIFVSVVIFNVISDGLRTR